MWTEFTSLFNLEILINPKIAIYFKYNKTEKKQPLYNKKKSYFLLVPTFDINFLISKKISAGQIFNEKSSSERKIYSCFK